MRGDCFRILGLPPGERYLAVAVEELDEGQEYDPEFLKPRTDATPRCSIWARPGNARWT